MLWMCSNFFAFTIRNRWIESRFYIIILRMLKKRKTTATKLTQYNPLAIGIDINEITRKLYKCWCSNDDDICSYWRNILFDLDIWFVIVGREKYHQEMLNKSINEAARMAPTSQNTWFSYSINKRCKLKLKLYYLLSPSSVNLIIRFIPSPHDVIEFCIACVNLQHFDMLIHPRRGRQMETQLKGAVDAKQSVCDAYYSQHYYSFMLLKSHIN